ncbi:hypothetical protein AB1Y20_011949 [Prymnesium parvum]|uniref:protein-tyrosine-phosphatase n=1 Tax=Prymnesium parvum TaxID=97485 RepID=A0AB34IN15_PRYPA
MGELQAALASRTPALSDLGGGILLGAGRAACDEQLLERARVTHVLNAADDVPRAAATAQLTYRCLGVADFGADVGISRVFEEAAAFVRSALREDGRVLIHCANGSNRSPTVAIAVHMILFDWTLAAAWEHVSSQRTVHPLRDNRRELLAFELARRGVNSMEEGDGGTLVVLNNCQDERATSRNDV